MARWDLMPGCHLDLHRYAGAAARFRPHHHETWDLSLILRGKVRERTGRREQIGQALDSVFKPAGMEHSDDFAGTVEILRLRLEADPIAQPKADAAPGGRWQRSQALARALLSLASQAQQAADTAAIEDAVVDIQGLLSRGDSAKSSRVPWMELLEEQIEDRLHEPLRVAELAEELGLHPVYLARMVRRVHGCSTRRLILSKRLKRAICALCEGRQPPAEVAAEAGFADQAHLTRELRREFAFTPAQLRQLCR